MTFLFNYAGLFFLFNREGKNVLKHSVLRNCGQKFMRNNKNNATLKMVQPEFSPGLGEIDGKMISTWNLRNKLLFLFTLDSLLLVSQAETDE